MTGRAKLSQLVAAVGIIAVLLASSAFAHGPEVETSAEASSHASVPERVQNAEAMPAENASKHAEALRTFNETREQLQQEMIQHRERVRAAAQNAKEKQLQEQARSERYPQ